MCVYIYWKYRSSLSHDPYTKQMFFFYSVVFVLNCTMLIALATLETVWPSRPLAPVIASSNIFLWTNVSQTLQRAGGKNVKNFDDSGIHLGLFVKRISYTKAAFHLDLSTVPVRGLAIDAFVKSRAVVTGRGFDSNARQGGRRLFLKRLKFFSFFQPRARSIKSSEKQVL